MYTSRIRRRAARPVFASGPTHVDAWCEAQRRHWEEQEMYRRIVNAEADRLAKALGPKLPPPPPTKATPPPVRPSSGADITYLGVGGATFSDLITDIFFYAVMLLVVAAAIYAGVTVAVSRADSSATTAASSSASANGTSLERSASRNGTAN